MNRRRFLKQSSVALAAPSFITAAHAAEVPGSKMKFGLVTYLWGQDWDLPTLIANCETAGYGAVELRTEHAHGVEPNLSAAQRAEVKKRFADSSVMVLGPGTNQDFHHADPAKLRESIEGTKAFLQLSHDIGGSGVKVKPNNFVKGVPKVKTLEQIGLSLKELGGVAADLGQEIRVEVHGQCSPPFYIEQVMEVADHPNVKVCWNCNNEDLDWKGSIDAGFNALKPWFGKTVHVRELTIGDYPYQQLMDLFVGMDYDGWVLLEARTKPADRIAALKEQLGAFHAMVKAAQAKG